MRRRGEGSQPLSHLDRLRRPTSPCVPKPSQVRSDGDAACGVRPANRTASPTAGARELPRGGTTLNPFRLKKAQNIGILVRRRTVGAMIGHGSEAGQTPHPG